MLRKNSTFYDRKKTFPLWLKIFFFVLIALALGGGSYLAIMTFGVEANSGPTDVDLLKLWEDREYEEIIAYTNLELINQPLDPIYLTLGAFSYFQQSLNLSTVEQRQKYVLNAINSLRKVLLLPSPPLVQQVHYILGKSYFHMGRYYSDLAIFHLLEALKLDFLPDDLYEYLGLSYFQIGQYKKSLNYFVKAQELNASDLLLWSMAQNYFQLNSFEETITYLQKVLDTTKDRSLELKSLFLIAESQLKLSRLDEAENTYLKILDLNPNSADAHYFLGEIYSSQGNKEKARSSWRRAVRIDPFHFNASRRL